MERKRRRWRGAAGLVLATCLLIATSGVTLADELDVTSKEIDMSMEIGWNGAFKLNAWAPLQVTLENKGQDFTGRLVLKKDMQSGNFRSTYEKEVVLPQGAKKRFTLDVPGMAMTEGPELQLLNADGEVVVRKGALPGAPIPEGILMGGLVEQESDLNMFSLVDSPLIGGKITTKSIDAEEVPDRPELLNSLDVFVVNHSPREELKSEQIAAVEAWVKNGGHLILAGGADYKGGSGQFAKLSPVAVTGTKELTNLSALQTYTGLEPNTNKLTVSNGTLEQGARALVRAGDVPLIAVRDVGAGQVLYVAYDLNAEPLASWQGNKELWGHVFSEITINPPENPRLGGDPTHMKMQLQREAGLFESGSPSALTATVVFGSYILLVGPLMYLALRRFNKREWGWVLIPATSVVWALGIYLIGTDQRSGDGMTQLLSVVDLKSAQTASVKSGAAFVVTNGGDYSVKFAPSMQTFVSNDYSSGNPSAQIQLEGNQHRISYKDVEFYTSRTAYAEGVIQDHGDFEDDLHVDKAGQVKGTIRNNSKFDLENALLKIGNELVKIGEIKQGESVKIEHKLGTQIPGISGVSQQLRETLAPNNTLGGDDPYQLHRTLIEFTLRPDQIKPSTVQLFGISKTPLDVFEIDGMEDKKHTQLSLVHQHLDLTYDDLGTEKPLGLIQGQVLASEGTVNAVNDGLMMQIGSVVLEYDVLSDATFVPQKVTTNLDQATYAMLEKELLNWQTGAWDTVAKANTPAITGDLVKKYVSEDGKLRIRLKGTSTNEQFVSYPNVGVEGKMSQ